MERLSVEYLLEKSVAAGLSQSRPDGNVDGLTLVVVMIMPMVQIGPVFMGVLPRRSMFVPVRMVLCSLGAIVVVIVMVVIVSVKMVVRDGIVSVHMGVPLTEQNQE